MPLSEPIRPLYDIEKSYAENLAEGPTFQGSIPKRAPLEKRQLFHFLGYQVRSPLGVPAGPLLNSRWTTLAAQLGFDIVTYKTIRSKQYSGHPLPNVIYVSPSPNESQIAYQTSLPTAAESISITNSFGMPSMSETYLQQDIAQARAQLDEGQLLIVSVVGTPGFSSTVTEDFIRAALLAKEAGAQVIEANFSCPNISSKEGQLYCDPDAASTLATRLSKAIAPLPLMIKVGAFEERTILQKFLRDMVKAGARGVCGINSLSMRVLNSNQEAALGPSREKSGVCGNLIRPAALQFIRDAAQLIDQEKLDLELAGCGGIMLPEQFDLFLEAGAKVAMSATGMMWDPFLASKWHEKHIQT